MSKFDWQVLPDCEHRTEFELELVTEPLDLPFLACRTCSEWGPGIPPGELVELIVTAAESLFVDYDPNINLRFTS